MRISNILTRKIKVKMYILIIGVCIALLLLILTITAKQSAGVVSSDNTSVRDAIAAQERQELNNVFAVYDTYGYPNADIPGSVLPSIRLYFHSAQALENVLVDSYGEQYELIDDELYRYIDVTLSELESAYANGTSPDQAASNLGVYMLTLESNLSKRFDIDNHVLPIAP